MKRVHKNRQRGAAMVEMCLLAPVMILMWMGIGYFRSGYARKLQAMSESHEKAWKLAYSNDGSCFANKEPWAGFTGENNPTDPGNTGEKGSEAATTFKSNTTSSLFEYGHANVQLSWQTRKAHWDGDAVGSLPVGTYVTCNEVVPATTAGDAGKFADQDVLTPVVDFVKSLF